MRKILVLRGGALGDFIVTLPALAALRQRWPDAQIELAGNASAAQLARARGLLDAVHSQHEARWGALFGAGALPREFAAWLAAFDLVVNFWPDADRDLSRRFPLRAGQIFLSASALPAQAPAASHYCEPLRALGIECGKSFFRLAEPALAPVRRGVAIHPGSGSPTKNWPADNWLALISKLPLPVSLVLGETEMEQWTSRSLPARVTPLLNLSLEDLAMHLASCRLFLGHDSGISHLAAACGVPGILLFGPTDPAMWAPPAAHVRVLRRGATLAAISLADVEREIASVLAGPT